MSRRTRTVAAALAVTAGVTLGLLGASSGPADAATRPTVVLVHGAWADGSSWTAVTKQLQRDGYTVDVLPNPLRGVASDAATVRAFLRTVPGRVVLVGHSYGGMVITNAAAGRRSVQALVYVDAYVPAVGDTVAGLTGAEPGSVLGGDPATIFDVVPFPDGSGADLYVKQRLFPGFFAAGVPAEKAAALAAGQRPLSAAALTERSKAAAWRTIPSWDVVGTADRIIPPAEQEAMAARAGAHVARVDAPHLSMVSDPAAVTRVIERAAVAAG